MKKFALLVSIESFMWECMDTNKRTQGGVNFYSYFFVLYAYRHQYPLEFETFKDKTFLRDVTCSDDDLFNMLYVVASKGKYSNCYEFQDVAHFYHGINQYLPEEFNAVYPNLIESLIEEMAMSAQRLDPEFVQPRDITDVVCHILKKHHAQDIYNPYSGLSSYAVGMKDAEHYNSYYGKEVNDRMVMLAQLRLDAYDMNDTATVEYNNVLHYWPVDFKKFDTVVATPPFGVRISERSFGCETPKSRTIEDTILWHCMEDTEGCRTAVVVVPTSFLARKDLTGINLRKTLCEKKVLEMIVNLPGNIFYGTGIATSILVLNLAKEQEFITIIDAQYAIEGEGCTSRLHSELIIDMIDGKNTEMTTMVPFDETFQYDCTLVASLYENNQILVSEDECSCRMMNLMEEVCGEYVDNLEQCNVLNQSDFSSDFFEVIQKEDVIVMSDAPMNVRKIHGPHLVLSMKDSKLALYMHKEDTDFYIRNHHLAIKPNKNIVIPEYLAYILLKSEWSKMIEKIIKGSHMQRIDILSFGNIKIAMLDLKSQQRSFVEELKKEYKEEKAKIYQAELERLGFRDVYSDVIHMLGTPFHKQAQVVKLLKKTNKDDERYTQRVKALMDISMYIQRVIDLVGKDFANTTLDLEKMDLSDFLIEYNLAWNNFASGVYRMQIEVDADGRAMDVEVDKDLLMVLMDTLMDNVKRHGFEPDYNPENVVNISLQHVKYNDKPCVLLSVSNNGYPMKDGFTIQDYITRGRYDGKNGRTGLGGNHVYTIVKKHGGWLNIRNDKSWNFIVDMLFPMANPMDDDFNDYDYEAI